MSCYVKINLTSLTVSCLILNIGISGKRHFPWLRLCFQYDFLQLTSEPNNLNSNHPSSFTPSEPWTLHPEVHMAQHIKYCLAISWQEAFCPVGSKPFITTLRLLRLCGKNDLISKLRWLDQPHTSKDFPFLMSQSGIYGKSPNSTSTIFCKENWTVPTQLS